MFTLTSTHREQMQALRDVIAGLNASIGDLRLTNYALDRTAAKFKAERDALQAKVNRMTRNLKRGRHKPGEGHGGITGNGSAGITAAVSVG